MPEILDASRLAHDLALRDLTDPAEGPHAIQLLVDIATQSLAQAWGCEVRVVRGPRIVTRSNNYDRLGYPPEAVTRDARYTRYVDDQRVLRSHTSALIPAALDALAPNPPVDVLIACPGITYRRDAIDRLHTGTPHQLDLWRVTRQGVGIDELDEMVRILADGLLPGRAWRWEPRVHPYTLAGRQVDALGDDGWVEVWECGLAHPAVLASAGLGSFSGLALGMGLERLLMVRKGIPDIRLLRSTDPRVAAQMLDLEPYRPVSHLPGIRRDLSVAVARGDDVETIGDRVRTALGSDADLLEAVTILSETPYEDVPAPGRVRLGMDADQKNVLVRLDIRPVERTLTDTEANELRNRVYAAIHQGAGGQWATS